MTTHKTISRMFAAISFGLFAFVALMAGQALAGSIEYNAAVLADSPVYYYTLDNGTTGLDNLGSAGGGVNDLGPSPTGPSYGSGGTTGGGASLGDAATFDGSANSRLVSGTLNGGSFSKYVVEFWFNGADSTTNQYMYSNDNNLPAAILGFTDGVFEVYSAGGRTDTDGPTGLADGDWHHVVLGIDSGGSHLIYIDDTLFSTTATSETISAWTASATMYLGGSAGGTRLIGSLDEFAVYDVGAGDLATVAADIADHFNVAGPTAPEPMSGLLLGMGLVGLALRRRRRGL